MALVERLWELVEPMANSHGVELYDIEHDGGILRVVIDRTGGIDLDAIGEFSLALSQALDLQDPLPDHRYLLEVTSPGIERRLRRPDHFQRQIGQEVAVKLRVAHDGVRRLQGRLVAADATAVDLETADPSVATEVRRVAYGDIESAHIVFHWGEGGLDVAGPPRSPTKTSNKKASAR